MRTGHLQNMACFAHGKKWPTDDSHIHLCDVFQSKFLKMLFISYWAFLKVNA